MTGLRGIGPDTVRDTLADALRLLVGQGKKYSVDQLADATGDGATTIKSYLNRRALPTADRLLRLIAVLGPAFGSALTRLAGMELTLADPEAVDLFEVHAENGALCAAMAEALRDGRFDHQEAARLRPQLEELHQTIGGLLTQTAQAKARHRR